MEDSSREESADKETSLASETVPAVSSGQATGQEPPEPGVVFARLFIGVVVLIGAEKFSGASLPVGLWHPWTLLVTYWLYFAHFFFFTTVALYTGRASFSSLYLWGVLYGLYESWITKVIWSGYGSDGKYVLGRIGPFGFGELSMVFLFHPLMSFILPLAVACLLCPPLRRLFPDLAWFTGRTKGARAMLIYVVFSFSFVVGMNCGGPVNLALNLAFVLVVLLILFRLAKKEFAVPDGRSIVAFGQRGFVGLCLYLALLYEVTYSFLRPEGLPSIGAQLFTLTLYALTIFGLWLHRRQEPLPADAVVVEPGELRLVEAVFALVIGLGFVLSFFAKQPFIFRLVAVNMAAWTLLGFLLMGVALGKGARECWSRDVSSL
jgi:hypothetical protein